MEKKSKTPQSKAETIRVSEIHIEWKPKKGTCTFEKLPVAMMWVDTTLAGVMSGVQTMVGTERFNLALQSEGRKSVEEDWNVISKFPKFKDGFKAIANIAAVAGWGKWKLVSLDEKKKTCHFRVTNSWEGMYQKALGVCWGSGMLAGKLAGYCSKMFKTNCWAKQTAYFARGDKYDEFIVKPSKRSLEKEIENLLTSDEATRADMAVALESLRREITERKKTEEILHKSEERFRSLTENTSDWIWEIDQNGIYTYSSPKVTELLGYEPEEIIGKTPFDFMSDDESKRIYKRFRSILKTRKPFAALENTNLHKDGQQVILETSGVPIFDKGNNFLGYRGIDRDITERKLLEEDIREKERKYRSLYQEFRGILDAIPDALVLLSRDLKVVWSNEVAAKNMNLSLDDFIGQHCYKLRHGRSAPCKICPVLECYKSHTPKVVEATTSDGRIWELHVYPVFGDRGEVKGVIEIAHNITERKKLEQQLLQAQKMEAVGQLAGGIAHDFNNILTAIIGYGHLLKNEASNDDHMSAYVGQILSATEKAAILTNDLLTFSRKQIINLHPVNLNKIIRNIESLLLRVIGEDIELSIVLTDADLTIMADSSQIDQIVMNLVTNARDAMPNGGSLFIRTDRIEINGEYIKAYNYGKPGFYALLSVEDTGIGMDEKIRERIFEPFFTTKEVGKGTGLGLSMVYGIVKQHNGYIKVYSEPGIGTTFKILLPLIQSKVQEIKPDNLQTIKGGTETILIGEDNSQVRNLMKEVLSNAGYRIMEATDGNDAVEVFHRNKEGVDLLILDMIMPKKNGKEVYEEIKKVKSDIKVIFVSGYSADIIHEKGILEVGLNFISKPISPDDILIKVREVLDN